MPARDTRDSTSGSGNGLIEWYACTVFCCLASIALSSDTMTGISSLASSVTRNRRKDLILLACTLPVFQPEAVRILKKRTKIHDVPNQW